MEPVRSDCWEFHHVATVAPATVSGPQSGGAGCGHNPSPMFTCTGKSLGYQGGVTLIILATGLALAGTATPRWLILTSQAGDVAAKGLWMTCADLSLQNCSTIALKDFAGFEKWTQIIVMMADLAFVCSSWRALNGGIEGWVDGVLSFIGAVIYAVNTKRLDDTAYGFGFFLVAAAAIVGVAGGLVVANQNWTEWIKDQSLSSEVNHRGALTEFNMSRLQKMNSIKPKAPSRTSYLLLSRHPPFLFSPSHASRVVLATVVGSIGLGAPGWFIARSDISELLTGLWQAQLTFESVKDRHSVLSFIGAVIYAVNTKRLDDTAYGFGFFLVAAAAIVGVAGGLVVANQNWTEWIKDQSLSSEVNHGGALAEFNISRLQKMNSIKPNKVYILGYAGIVLATVVGSIGLGAPGWFIASPQTGVEAFAARRRTPLSSAQWAACLLLTARAHGSTRSPCIDLLLTTVLYTPCLLTAHKCDNFGQENGIFGSTYLRCRQKTNTHPAVAVV
ncbi:hypothetical protein C0Q70_03347 [Pomacea canaliculata]|uniref:Uncharacterized protein n=1 Tax=Pomacea canaliculata TaxID=400727 RepID=A0A2T7PSG8_POMCA|nr:hypothetical protein C0Q70_03347 [Pomacea canaliculata]